MNVVLNGGVILDQYEYLAGGRIGFDTSILVSVRKFPLPAYSTTSKKGVYALALRNSDVV